VLRRAGIRARRRSGNLYILVSVTIHLLIVLVFGLSGLSFRKPGTAGLDTLEVDHHAFHVIEVPDNIPEERPVKPSGLASDRTAVASGMNPLEHDDSVVPFSEGVTEIPEFNQPGSEADQPRKQAEVEKSDGRQAQGASEPGDFAGETQPEGIGEYIVDGGEENQNVSTGRPSTFRNVYSDAARKGALSFNTYDWDFAPYMLAMKRAIQNHMFPPYAFTHMGLISGNNIVRFTVMPDGRIKGLEVLGSDAHFSLDRTSVRAVESSVPFLPLPADFPEDYLEVTAHFSYVVERSR